MRTGGKLAAEKMISELSPEVKEKLGVKVEAWGLGGGMAPSAPTSPGRGMRA